jgi:hypothetical protein
MYRGEHEPILARDLFEQRGDFHCLAELPREP